MPCLHYTERSSVFHETITQYYYLTQLYSTTNLFRNVMKYIALNNHKTIYCRINMKHYRYANLKHCLHQINLLSFQQLVQYEIRRIQMNDHYN